MDEYKLTYMPQLTIEKRGELGLIPEIVGYLSSIAVPDYIYTDYKVRHPAGVFNLATYYVVMDFIELLKELEENQRNYNNTNKLDSKFRNLINNFFKFYDSCYEIMLGCCKQHAPPSENEFIYRWLENENRHPGQIYSVGTKFYINTKDKLKYFRELYNKLKHTSNNIHEEYFQDTSHVIMGFYLEAVTDIRTVGPDDHIHPRFNGNVKSANSYNFKLRELYYLLYFISNELKKALETHYMDVYSINLVFDENVNSEGRLNDQKWRDLLERIKRLPQDYYPNEFGMNIYNVREESDRMIFEEITARRAVLAGHFGGKQRLDGFTSTMGLPYISEDTFRP
jgi:hypothetical protein